MKNQILFISATYDYSCYFINKADYTKLGHLERSGISNKLEVFQFLFENILYSEDFCIDEDCGVQAFLNCHEFHKQYMRHFIRFIKFFTSHKITKKDPYWNSVFETLRMLHSSSSNRKSIKFSELILYFPFRNNDSIKNIIELEKIFLLINDEYKHDPDAKANCQLLAQYLFSSKIIWKKISNRLYINFNSYRKYDIEESIRMLDLLYKCSNGWLNDEDYKKAESDFLAKAISQ